MLKILSQPYPFFQDWRQVFVRHAWIGLFVALFLIIFQPFDTNNWHVPYKALKLAGYGVIGFLMPTLLVFLIERFKTLDQWERIWTVGKELFFTLGVIIVVSFGNMLYSNFLHIGKISFYNFINFIFVVFVIGIFPIGVGISLRFRHFMQLNETEAIALRTDIEHIQTQHNSATQEAEVTFVAENEKDVIRLHISDLLYIESADNYANFVFLKQGRVQKELLRGPLKRFEQQCTYFSLVKRCHRSFVVNLQHVTDIEGNAQGYRVSLQHSDSIIPVARNYGAAIKAHLTNILEKNQ
jgi:hypothetical protein